jgi:hypothetical protein
MLILERVFRDDETGRECAVPLAVAENPNKLKMYNQYVSKAAWEQVGDDKHQTPKVGLGYWQIRWILRLDNL